MLEVRGLSKSFGPRRVVDGVSFRVAPGELVALVGENGAGKSTLVRCIAGASRPDSGEVVVGGGRLAVVWQDLALCDNLDVVANMFLGNEPRRLLLDELEMRREARRLLGEIGVHIPDLAVPVGELSGGQRQMVAIARALRSNASVLVLDEPSAALGVTETRLLEDLLRRLRNRGIAILMVSHRIDQVFALADRILVIRHGRIAADVSPFEVHPDDVVSLMAGTSIGSTARSQLNQLLRLVDELADVEPAASLPLILTSLSRSLTTRSVGLWLRRNDRLALAAEVGLNESLSQQLASIPASVDGGVVASALSGSTTMMDDVSSDVLLGGFAASAWAVPVHGPIGPVGVIAGFGERVGRPGADQFALVELHANLASVALEREALVAQLRDRNKVLESLRSMLDQLAGPDQLERGMSVALRPLRDALGAAAVAVHEWSDHGVATVHDMAAAAEGAEAVQRCAALATALPPHPHPARPVGDNLVAVTIGEGSRMLTLSAAWSAHDQPEADAFDLLNDAARSLALSSERAAAERARRESAALRQANELQRDFLHRLSHELRTPLTAIRGYADTLLQADVTWDGDSRSRFLWRIADESARLGRLVGDLLDSSAIESRQLRLLFDWCDLEAVVEEAIAVVFRGGERERGDVCVEVTHPLPPVWADHDRVEQVLVNLLENARRHGSFPITIRLRAISDGNGRELVEGIVADAGDGFPAELVELAFDAHVSSGRGAGAGLGLSIAKGLVEAHDGIIGIASRQPAAVEFRLPVEPLLVTDELTPLKAGA